MASYARCIASRGAGGGNRLFGALVDISERKLAEEKLRTAETEARRLLASADSTRRALLSVVEDQKKAEAALGRASSATSLPTCRPSTRCGTGT